MAKKRKPPVTAPSDSPIQYRPGHLLADLLDKFAGDWQVSVNEASRRLAALAAHQLDARHHDLVREYAEKMYGTNDFVDACQRISIELQAADTARIKVGAQRMAEEERQAEIVNIVRVYAMMHRDPEEPEKEQVRVRIFNK